MAFQNTQKEDFKKFNPSVYLEMRYQKATDYYRFTFPLEKYHAFFSTLLNDCTSFNDCNGRLKILEYGCGPVIMYLISAAPFASEIVMADKVPECLEEVKRWILGDQTAFDWTAHFDHVVQKLEGKGNREARDREMELRRKIKAVVSCDIFEDNPIEVGYEGPYDIVMSNMCIDGVCKSIEEFEVSIRKLARLLKPGGKFTIITNSNLNLGSYCTYGVGDLESGDTFPSIGITRKYLLATLENSGFTDVHVDGCEHGFKEAVASGSVGAWALHQPEDFLGFLFVYATKKP